MHSAGHDIPIFLIVIIATALVFDFCNGFHDTANAIATVVATRVLKPWQAIAMSATLNFAGAFISTNVAQTIAKGLITAHASTQTVVFAALLGAIAWDLITWWLGIPSSSSHALVGGLVGAALVFGGMHAVQWHGVVNKVLLPLIASPIVGFILAFLLMSALYALFGGAKPEKVSHIFHKLQTVSAGAMALNHGLNDAQKTMGVITLALVAFHLLPGGHKTHIPAWVIASCATSMGLGTAIGGWRIIKTMGTRIIRLEPINGFAAETAASVTIWIAAAFGAPVSTTHIVSGSVFGVAAARRIKAARWGVAGQMLTAWGLTLPAAGAVAALCFFLLRLVHVG
jgi:PiT family inorganic phosphate transporter